MAATRVLSPVANFGRAPMGLLEGDDVSDAEVRAYAWLTTWDFQRTGRMYTGREEMAAALHWSISKLDGALRALEKRGAIQRVRRGLGQCNDILLLAEIVEPCDSGVTAADRLESHDDATLSASMVRLPIQERTPRENQETAATAAPSSRRRTDPRSDAITKQWWEERDPKPLQNYPAVRGIVDKALRAGHTADAVLVALRRVSDDPPVVAWKLERALMEGRPKRQDPRSLNWDRQ